MIRFRINRAFRLPVFALVLVFALSVLGPGVALAKVNKKNGHKGTEGDPGDGFGSPMAGGGFATYQKVQENSFEGATRLYFPIVLFSSLSQFPGVVKTNVFIIIKNNDTRFFLDGGME